MPKRREWYYLEPHALDRAIFWNLGPWEVHYDRNLALRPLPVKVAKGPTSPRSRIRDGHVQPRMESGKETRVMDLHSSIERATTEPFFLLASREKSTKAMYIWALVTV